MEKNVFKKLIGKKSAGIVVTILTFVIVFGAIFSISNLNLAKDTLPGIGDIRDYISGENHDYKVLEIVPTLDTAQFGFLVAGEEPLDAATLYDGTTKNWISWQKYMADNIDSLTSTKDQRVTYMNSLAVKNQAYITSNPTDLSKPVYYKTYTEDGVTADTADGSFASGNVQVKGYFAADPNYGSGWNVQFLVQLDNTNTYQEMLDGETPYYVTDGIVPLTAEIVNAEQAVYPNSMYLYEQHLSGHYVPSITFGELKTGVTNGTISAAEIGNYYDIRFRVLASNDFSDELQPSVYAASGWGEYVESGAAYTIIANANQGHTLDKPGDRIYYQGGFYSNELFKRFTLDIDDADVANYKVDVQTVTAGELNAMTAEELTAYLATVDFIYLNAGENNGSIESYVQNNTDRDLDAEAVKLIFEKICNEKTPCIVDHYITVLAGLSGSSVSNTNAYALACMLMQSDYRSLLTNGKFEKDIAANLDSWANSLKDTNDFNYVNGNVMVINSDKNSTPSAMLTDKFYGEAFSSTIVETAYKAVLNEIELENLYRASDQAAGYAPLDTTIYKSTVVRYIMNYVSARTIQAKTSIEVLEIQPANVKYPGNSESSGVVGGDKELTPSRVRKWMNVGNSVEVNITTMNTMEYIGTIEDINSKYDLIYIGADIYSLPNNGSTTNYYEVGDESLTHPKYSTSTYPSMDKLIYSNVGGLVPVNGQFAGHLAIDWKTSTQVYNYVMARYNGNDITADKHNELVDYVKGTYTIVVADKLCKSTTEPEKTYVDNCSYLYSFLKEHLKDANVFKASEVENGSNATFQFYTNRGKLDIGQKVTGNEESNVKGGTAFVQPGYYKATDDTTNGHMTYINKETDGKYYLTYKFTITNEGAVYANTKYKAALYIDSNSDGKFSLEFEDIPDVTITNVATGAVVTNGELVAGIQYSLVKEIPNSYNVVTWKVEVSQTDNKNIRDSVTGYTRLSDRQKVTLKILQIRRDGGTPLVLETAIGNGRDKGSNDTLNALVYGGYCDADKKTYTGISNEYDFKFTTMTNKQFNTAYANGTLNLMSYDMVILGFYDSYNLRGGTETDINYNSVMGKGGLREYIDSGKSVLFAHDTTSITAVENYKKVTVAGKGDKGYIYDASGVSCSVWGYYLNIYVRDMVGLDTYGITLGKLGPKDGIDYSMVSSGQDLSTSTEGQKLMAALENKLDADGYYKIGLKPVAYVPNSNKTKTVRETQGFLYGWMDWHWKKASKVTYRKVRTKYNTDRAERVNEGQITTYPYYLDETIDIARTHHQYFTLDLTTDDDKDGETDLVVWYTMGGKEGDNSYLDTKEFTSNPNNGFSTKDSNFDDTSEKDVMNNYYIYNKGNITYTGFGDFNDNTWLGRGNVVDECKLFINTLVAAYQAGASDSSVSVFDTPDGTVPTDTFFEYGDTENNIAFRTESQRMYFNITDKNVIRGEKKAWARYYVALKPGTVDANATSYNGYAVETIEDKQCIDVSRHLVTYDLAGTKIDTAEPADIEKNKPGLDCDTMYYVDIPTTGDDSIFNLKGVDGQNTNTFFMKTKVILRQTGSLTDAVYIRPTTETIKKVEFTQLELFPLD